MLRAPPPPAGAVGDAAPANLDAVKNGKLPKKARDRLNDEIAKLGF